VLKLLAKYLYIRCPKEQNMERDLVLPYYERLGLPPAATYDEVVQAYFRKVSEFLFAEQAYHVLTGHLTTTERPDNRPVDTMIVALLLERFWAYHGSELRDPITFARLQESASEARLALETSEETSISLPFVSTGEGGPIHLKVMLTRMKLRELEQAQTIPEV
jgi:hypothetical protein